MALIPFKSQFYVRNVTQQYRDEVKRFPSDKQETTPVPFHPHVNRTDRKPSTPAIMILFQAVS